MMDAADFDAWHAAVAESAGCARLYRRALGLPPEIVSNSLLTWEGIAEVEAALRLAPGQVLVDVACGRGGYGREVARRAGARLVGLDFSAVAVALAASAAGPEPAGFCVSDFAALGLRDHCADAVMCVDSVQFGDPPLAVLRECRRVLAVGGRLAVTTWEAVDPSDELLPARTRRMNLARDLAAAGFERVEVTAKPGWYEAERVLWETATRTDPGDDDPGLVELRREARLTLPAFARKRRVLATATAGAPGVTD